jgi:hypothetical protein
MNPILVVVALAVLAGQAAGPAVRASRGARSSATTVEAHRLTGEEIRRSHARNAYEAIQLLRPAWLGLQPLGEAESLGPAVVYVDSREIGSVDALAQVPVREIRSIRFLDAANVPADHVRPSILITSR